MVQRRPQDGPPDAPTRPPRPGGDVSTSILGVAPVLVAAAWASQNLKNKGTLKKTLDMGVRALLPPAMAEAAAKILAQSNLKLGRTAIREAQLALDIAVMLDNRATQRYVPSIKYVWLDSSPQGGKDWLLG